MGRASAHPSRSGSGYTDSSSGSSSSRQRLSTRSFVMSSCAVALGSSWEERRRRLLNACPLSARACALSVAARGADGCTPVCSREGGSPAVATLITIKTIHVINDIRMPANPSTVTWRATLRRHRHPPAMSHHEGPQRHHLWCRHRGGDRKRQSDIH